MLHGSGKESAIVAAVPMAIAWRASSCHAEVVTWCFQMEQNKIRVMVWLAGWLKGLLAGLLRGLESNGAAVVGVAIPTAVSWGIPSCLAGGMTLRRV